MVRITLEKIVFDGVGPFRQREVFEPQGRGVTYFYAPNGHGKTSTIDLVRWLIRGRFAVEKNEFRSLQQDAEKNIVNHHRFRNMKGGRAEAILAVEGKGRYRLVREIPFGTSPESSFTVWEQVAGPADAGLGDLELEAGGEAEWRKVDEPYEFVSKLLPHERLGFNLLTGEHVKEFVEELSGPVVKRSVERLLQNPELVSLYDALSAVRAELDEKAAAEQRAENRKLKLREKRADLKERYRNFRDQVEEHEREEERLQAQVEDLKQDLARLEELDGLKQEREELVASIDELEERQQREIEALGEALTPAWRSVMRSTGATAATELLEQHEQARSEHQAWRKAMGVVEYLHDELEAEACHCGRELEDQHRTEIQGRIKQLQADEPTVPTLPVEAFTLRSWAQADGLGELVTDVQTHQQRLADIEADLAEKRDRLATIEGQLEAAGADAPKKLQRKIKRRKMRIKSIREEKAKALRNQMDSEEQLNDTKQKLRDTGAEPVDGTLVKNAQVYTDGVREVIDRALPALRDRLLDRTQGIFDELFQKESQYRIKLSTSSMIPHVVREVDGEEEPVRLSEGEKTRLGLSLLFALREVASEHPFLLLDAPFSTLDDEGTYRLLELIGGHDGQVVVFTKSAFPEGRWYEAVEQAEPKVYRMDWVKSGPDDLEGFTQISQTEVTDLRLAQPGGGR